MPTQEPRHSRPPAAENLPEPRAPQWVSYVPPAPTRRDRFMRMLRRYGFAGTSVALALCVVILLLRPRPERGEPSSARRPVPASADASAGERIEGTATLSVMGGPAGATVLLNRQPVGDTPLQRHTAAAGVYLLSVQKPGYAPLDSVVVLRKDTHLMLSVALAEAEQAPGAGDGGRVRVEFRDQQTPAKVPRHSAEDDSRPQGWRESEEARRERISGYVEALLVRQQPPADTAAAGKSTPPQEEQQVEQDSTTFIHW